MALQNDSQKKFDRTHGHRWTHMGCCRKWNMQLFSKQAAVISDGLYGINKSWQCICSEERRRDTVFLVKRQHWHYIYYHQSELLCWWLKPKKGYAECIVVQSYHITMKGHHWPWHSGSILCSVILGRAERERPCRKQRELNRGTTLVFVHILYCKA